MGSSSCLSSGSSAGVRKQVFCEARTIGQLYNERIASLKLKEEKYKKKLRVIKSQLKVQYRERHEFFQELRGFTQCQIKQVRPQNARVCLVRDLVRRGGSLI